MKIKIDVKLNPKEYGHIAFLVDRPDFLEDISHLRKKWLPQGHSIPLDYYSSWLDKIEKKMKISKSEWIVRLNKAWSRQWNFVPARVKKVVIPILSSDRKATEKMFRIIRQNPKYSFLLDIRELRMSYFRPGIFHTPIAKAVACGRVSKNDFRSCYPMVIYPNEPNFITEQLLYDNYFAIAVTPYASQKDLMEAFEELRGEFETKGHFVSGSYERVYEDLFKPSTFGNIKRDRDWYWLNKAGHFGYGKIEKMTGDPKTTIITAIKSYKGKLFAKIE